MMAGYILKPSLQQFSAAQIAVELWKAEDVREELESFVSSNDEHITGQNLAFYERKVCADNILREVTRKLVHLPLPQLLKPLVTNHLGLIGNQISTTYVEFFSRGTKPSFDFYFSRLQWTPFGTVDKQRTVESLMDEKSIPICERYVLACNYCCNSSDESLWIEWSARVKDFIARNEIINCGVKLKFVGSWKDRKTDLLELFHGMNGSLKSVKQLRNKCLTDICCENGMTFERFWLNLSDEEKIGKINWMAEEKFTRPFNCCTEIIFFFIEEMNGAQRTMFFQNNKFRIREILLNDPLRWQKSLEIVHKLCKSCISESRFLFITVEQTWNKRGIEDFADRKYFRNIFEETWIRSSMEFKRDVLERPSVLIYVLVASEDADSIRMMRNDATRDEKEEIDSCVRIALYNTPLYVQKEDFGYISRFLKKIKLSKEDIASLKYEIFCENHYYFCAKFISEGKWETANKFVDWAATSHLFDREDLEFVAYKKGLEICYPWIIGGDYFAIDKFVNWCFSSSSLEMKTEFKMLILQPEVVASLESGDFEMADIFYNWFLQKSKYFIFASSGFVTKNFDPAIFY